MVKPSSRQLRAHATCRATETKSPVGCSFPWKKNMQKMMRRPENIDLFHGKNNEVTFQTYGNELAHENNWKYMKHTWQWRSTYGRNTCNSYGPNMVQMVELPWFVTSHQRPRRPSAKVIRVNHQARIDKLQLPPISPKKMVNTIYNISLTSK